MKVLLLSTNDILGGAAMVTYRLMEALRNAGTDARMLVANRRTDNPDVARVGQLCLKTAFVAERGEIFLNNGFNLDDLWKVSTGSFGADVCSHPWVREADVIVLNWICQGFLSLGQIERLCSMGKPVVWIMHDLWCATGICHLPGTCTRHRAECGHCPLLHWERGVHDLSHRVWRRKKRLFSENRIEFVAVSNCQRKEAMQSGLLGDKAISVIPHAFPVELYHTTPTAGVSSTMLESVIGAGHQRIITMGAARLDDPVKDLPMAIRSLNHLVEKRPDLATGCRAIFFGSIRNPELFNELRMDYTYAGPLSAEELRQLYSASSVVLSTSRFETMGATLMEGMAGGAVPVTFGNGGQTDIVTDRVNGFIATYGSHESVADCIAEALWEPFDRNLQHESVRNRFSSEVIASRYINLFNSLITGKCHCPTPKH